MGQVEMGKRKLYIEQKIPLFVKNVTRWPPGGNTGFLPPCGCLRVLEDPDIELPRPTKPAAAAPSYKEHTQNIRNFLR